MNQLLTCVADRPVASARRALVSRFGYLLSLKANHRRSTATLSALSAWRFARRRAWSVDRSIHSAKFWLIMTPMPATVASACTSAGSGAPMDTPATAPASESGYSAAAQSMSGSGGVGGADTRAAGGALSAVVCAACGA